MKIICNYVSSRKERRYMYLDVSGGHKCVLIQHAVGFACSFLFSLTTNREEINYFIDGTESS